MRGQWTSQTGNSPCVRRKRDIHRGSHVQVSVVPSEVLGLRVQTPKGSFLVTWGFGGKKGRGCPVYVSVGDEMMMYRSIRDAEREMGIPLGLLTHYIYKLRS